MIRAIGCICKWSFSDTCRRGQSSISTLRGVRWQRTHKYPGRWFLQQSDPQLGVSHHQLNINGLSGVCRMYRTGLRVTVPCSKPRLLVVGLTLGIVTKLINARWLYLTFFNGLWVIFPLWILWEAYRAMSSAMSQAEMVDLVNYLKKDD